MKVKAPISFKCKKLLNPCRKILQIFKFRFQKPLFIRTLQFCQSQTEVRKRPERNRIIAFLSVFHSCKQSRKMDQEMEFKSFSDAGHQKAPFLSPLTPAYVRMGGAAKKEVSGHGDDDVEDAYRSFENYLVEMIVEEGKVNDLMDVEELLYSWKNLKCPVFIDLVCRFYGELCKDLFSSNEDCIESS